MKMLNFASLDEAITSTGRRGLSAASSTDRLVWNEMQSDWQMFVVEADEAAKSFGMPELAPSQEDPDDYTGSEKPSETMARVGQGFFRRAVLSAYDFRCCVTGLSAPTLLSASHIVPWSVDASNRLNPRNGLCLSALHDRAFDAGIISISENLTVLVASSAVDRDDPFFESALVAYDGKSISLPDKFRPDRDFIRYHRRNIFQG
jgi:predicted restriction endonuclease